MALEANMAAATVGLPSQSQISCADREKGALGMKPRDEGHNKLSKGGDNPLKPG